MDATRQHRVAVQRGDLTIIGTLLVGLVDWHASWESIVPPHRTLTASTFCRTPHR
jgi:hypothetical protein